MASKDLELWKDFLRELAANRARPDWQPMDDRDILARGDDIFERLDEAEDKEARALVLEFNKRWGRSRCYKVVWLGEKAALCCMAEGHAGECRWPTVSEVMRTC